jgi:hypothetical protein
LRSRNIERQLRERIVRFVMAAKSTTVPDILRAVDGKDVRERDVRRIVITLLNEGQLDLDGKRKIILYARNHQ